VNFLAEYFAIGVDPVQALPAAYDWRLVVASITIACLAGYTFLGLAIRIRTLDKLAAVRGYWITGGAVIMGTGVWAMHFVAMLAYRLPIPVQYSTLVTALSVLPAMIGSAIALYVVVKGELNVQRLLVGGISMGAGIGTMHYTGMAAMRLNAFVRYDPSLFALSILVAIALAIVALSTALWSVRGRHPTLSIPRHLLGAVLMGFAVSGMHYTAMSSTLCFAMPGTRVVQALDPEVFAAAVTIVAFLLLLITIGSMVFEQRLSVAIAHGERAGEQLRFREQRLNLIMNNVADALITIDNGGIVRSFNKSAERIFGYEASEIVGQNVMRLMFESDRSIHSHAMDQYMKTGESEFVGKGAREVTGRHKDGSKIDIELLVSEFVEGDARMFIGALRDITRRKSTEAQLLQAQKMEAVGQLSGGIAHDFNNMLGIIIGNLDLLREKLDSRSGVTHLVESALDSALRGAELNRRLLAFSLRQSLNPEVVDVRKLFSGMTGLIKSTLGEKVHCRFDMNGDIWAIRADLVQLESTIINIALNARDAMPDGGRFTVAAENRAVDETYSMLQSGMSPGEYVCLSLTDTGTGMSPEVLKRAFEPFYTTKGIGKGSGLGLSMVFGFMKQSRGHVNIYSEPGRGTTIRLYLARAGKGETAAVRFGDRSDAVQRGNETVLVVEDNAAMRKVVVDQLKTLGYSVIEAGNAREALTAIINEPHIDLMFSDVVMPGPMDGIALRQAAMKVKPGLKVLLTSGFLRSADGASTDAGERQFSPTESLLMKPYRKQDLAAAVRKTLDG